MSQDLAEPRAAAERLLAIAASLRGALDGHVAFIAAEGPVWIALRRQGRRLRAGWCEGTGHAVASLLSEFGRGGGTRPDRLEISFLRNPQPVEWTARTRRLTARMRGLLGFEIACDRHVERFAPTTMIASNFGFDQAIEGFLIRHGLDEKRFLRRGGSLTAYDAASFLVPLDQGPAVPLFRGGRLVAEDAIDRAALATMTDGLAAWLTRQIDPSGRATYKAHPSRGEVSGADNALRQFQATLALGRLARLRRDPRLVETAQRNLEATLARFFVAEGTVGMIVWDGTAGLGAAALAALAILEMPDGATRHAAAFAALSNGIDVLWHESGRFRTYHLPQQRDDNRTFYPGFALSFWTALWLRTGNPVLLDRIERTVAHYRQWFDEAPRPTLALAHAEAASILTGKTGEQRHADWLFQLCDSIPPLQETAADLPADLAGRFYDPRRPHLGRPHAATTASYVAALADGLAIARLRGDEARAAGYALAIRRGLRNLRQLQFRDEVDMFYLTRPDTASGGLRAEVYDNTIRIDAAAEALRALLKLEERGLLDVIAGGGAVC